VNGIYPGAGIVRGPQVLQRHGHPGNLVVGRGAVTAAVGHDQWPAATPFLPIRPTSTCVVTSTFIRLVRFSFLILIGRFVTLDL
jgi:hypothetical protein